MFFHFLWGIITKKSNKVETILRQFQRASIHYENESANLLDSIHKNCCIAVYTSQEYVKSISIFPIRMQQYDCQKTYIFISSIFSELLQNNKDN